MKAGHLRLALVMLLLSEAPALAQGVVYEMVPVADAGNLADTSGYGAVPYEFRIGKYEVTIGQYAAFLNAVAGNDPNGLYEPSINWDTLSGANAAGIERHGVPGAYTYSVTGPSGVQPAGADSPADRPISCVTWYNAARFANWLSNGQPLGEQGPTTTENGAYDLLFAVTTNSFPAANPTNPNTGAEPLYRMPTEDEWYKAAYYSPVMNSGVGGYYAYATQSNMAPGNTLGMGANQANYRVPQPAFVLPGVVGDNSLYAVTQSSISSKTQNYLTNVGAFSGSPGPYGTFDQNGNIQEWNDLTGAASSMRGLRGGGWPSTSDEQNLSSSARFTAGPLEWDTSIGFRLASPVPVPEPATWAMGAVGLAVGAWIGRRRKLA